MIVNASVGHQSLYMREVAFTREVSPDREG